MRDNELVKVWNSEEKVLNNTFREYFPFALLRKQEKVELENFQRLDEFSMSLLHPKLARFSRSSDVLEHAYTRIPS